MIDEKKINQATEKYLEEEGYKPYIEKAFQDGAQWAQEEFVKSLWHDVSEEAKPNKEIIVQTKYNGVEAFEFSGTFDWEYIAHSHNIIRWAYLDDILPKEGGEE